VVAITQVSVIDRAITGLSAAGSGPTRLASATAFTATILDGSNVSYVWDFGDGTTGSGANASRTYAAVGSYTAVVTAANGVGQATVSTQVTVMAPPVAGGGATLIFDGSNDVVDLGNVAALNGVSQYTLEGWVRLNSYNAWSTLFAKRQSDGDRAVVLQLYGSSGQLAVAVNGGYGYTSQAVPLNRWVHLAVVFHGTQGTAAEQLKLYVDGVLTPLTFGGTIPSTTPTSATRLTLGAEYNGTAPIGEGSSLAVPFAGQLDEIRLWHVARSQSQIQTTMNSRLSGKEAGLAAYWPLDEGSGSVTADRVGSQSGGLFGGPVWSKAGLGLDLTLVTQTNSPITGTLAAIDPAGGAVTFTVATAPALGTLQITAAQSGAFVYTPSSGYSGLDTFVYQVANAYGLTDTAAVTVNILPSPPPYLSQWGSSGSGNGQFNGPVRVTVDAAGNVYAVDHVNHRIQKFSSTGVYLMQIGSYGGGAGQLSYPVDVAVERSGSLYVVDRNNHRIQKFSSSGAFLLQWGTLGGGNGQFNTPYGVAVDSTGNVYVADYGNHRIQKFNSSGVWLAQWGTAGSGNGQFNGALAVAVDSNDRVYVVDLHNRRIQKFDNSGMYLAQWGTAGSGNGQFNGAYGIAVDSQNSLYVADFNANRIQKFTDTGLFVSQWGVGGSGNGQFNGAHGVAVDPLGAVYVADYNGNRIQKFGFSLTVTTAGAGSVTSTPAGVACGSSSSCTVGFFNTPITLTATPIAGSDFIGWSGACTGTGSCVVTTQASQQVTATFAMQTGACIYQNRRQDLVWVDDNVPAGAIARDIWQWTTTPTPFSGSLVHGNPAATGALQHYFENVTTAISLTAGDRFYAYVYLDPANPPQQLMLQFKDGNSSWEHRAYWGANILPWGTDNTTSRRFMGPLPLAGGWARLEVPVEQVGLAGQSITGMAFAQYAGQVWWDAVGINSSCKRWDASWVDDSLPAGAIARDTWQWTTTPAPFSGSLVHGNPAATELAQHYFENAAAPIPLTTGDRLYAYVYLDPANPPQQIMLQFKDGNSSWEHRAYWGANLIPSENKRFMGPLPLAGGWVRLEVPVEQVGLAGQSINGMAFTQYAGRVWWDDAGLKRIPASLAVVSRWDTSWVDDTLPAGAIARDTWQWTTTPTPFSGSLVHGNPATTGALQHYFEGATTAISLTAGDRLYTYVYLDPVNPPQQLMLQFKDGNSSWEHRAYWGANILPVGTDNTTSRRFMGPLPLAGGWVRLEVPVEQVGLAGQSINGIAFAQYAGQVWWDDAGVNRASAFTPAAQGRPASSGESGPAEPVRTPSPSESPELPAAQLYLPLIVQPSEDALFSQPLPQSTPASQEVMPAPPERQVDLLGTAAGLSELNIELQNTPGPLDFTERLTPTEELLPTTTDP
jgi:hypothetical protein